MDNEEVHRRAEERRRKIIANADARLKRITDLAKMENKAHQPSKTTTGNEFVDFEVDSFVNEKNGTSKFSVEAQHLNSVPDSSSSTDGEFKRVSNGSRMRNGSGPSQENLQQDEFLRMFQRGTFGSNNLMFPSTQGSMALPTDHSSDQRLPNGLDQMNFQDLNNSMNAMFSSQNPADLSNLLNALSGLASASGSMPRPQPASPPQEDTHPALKPALNIIVFLILGLMTRIFFQFFTLKINVFAPFLCLAIPIAIMSWGRRRTPITGLLSVVMLFVRSPWTQSLILNWVRLTALLRGISRLFACYLFSFVITHVIFELSTIHKDITEHSSPTV